MTEAHASPLDVFYPNVSHADPLWSVETGGWSRAGVAAALAGLPTADGIVVDSFACHPALVVEAVAAGRPLVAASLDPTTLLALRLAVTPPDQRRLDAAFSRLADARYGQVAFARHVEQLYRTQCPFCDAALTAAHFVWDDDEGAPVEKWCLCRACGRQGPAPTTDADRALARSVEAKGPRYWQLLGRLVPPGDELSERAEELVGIYTPRSRQALLTVALQIESAITDAEEQRWLRGMLLSCLERGHSVRSPAQANRPLRPARLRLPRRYIEHNVWGLMESAYRALRQRQTSVPDGASVWSARMPPAAGKAVLQQATARAVAQALAGHTADLIITDAPRADPLAYALAFLWTGWLYGRAAAEPLRPLAARRSVDWDWYVRSLAAVLRSLVGVLQPQGRVVLADGTPSAPEHLAALLLAAERAGLRLAAASALREPDGVAHRLIFQRAARGASDHDGDRAPLLAPATGPDAVVDALRTRGQPTEADILARAVLWDWARAGASLSARAAAPPDLWRAALSAVEQRTDDNAIVPMSSGDAHDEAARPEIAAWWLADPPATVAPLADRIEYAVLTRLRQREGWTEAAMLQAVCGAFPGVETPDVALVQTILRSYAAPEGDRWRLRVEDEMLARIAEVSALVDALVMLGRALGYQAEPVTDRASVWWPCSIMWFEQGQAVYGFVLQETAAVGPWLAAPPAPLAGVARYILLPASRSGLLTHKLRHVAGWSAWLARAGWQFAKNRHWRRLAQTAGLNRDGFRARLHLDPIVAAEAAQLPLF